MARTFDRAVSGFNHNITHRQRVFHVQTEDSGVNNPTIVTLLYVGGNILAQKKTSYAELLDAPNLAEQVRSRMEEQHKEMLRNVRAGVYDGTENANAARAYQPGQLADDVPKAPAGAPPPPAATKSPLPIPLLELAPLEPTAAETLFGEDLVSEKSLDEVILGYLTSEKGD
ncbi:MAG: hypothetical protein ACLQDQ_09190 [Myxococcaceae bacterium]